MELTLILDDDIHVFPPRGVPRHIVGNGGTIAALEIVAHLPQRKHGIKLLRFKNGSNSCDSNSCDSRFKGFEGETLTFMTVSKSWDSKIQSRRRGHVSQVHGLHNSDQETLTCEM